MSAQRIWQNLVAEEGFDESCSSVKRFVRRLGAKIPLPFRRMECEPVRESQVDFGSGAWIVQDGKKDKTGQKQENGIMITMPEREAGLF